MSGDEDPFRYCVHCRADCYVDESQHTDDCPQTTGVYPVTMQSLGMRGPDDPYAYGMRCMDCSAEFKLGEHYTHRLLEDGDPDLLGMAGAPIYEVICLGCAALGAT